MALIAALLVQRVSRRQSERALRASEARTQATLRALPDLIFVMSREGVYLDYYATDENEKMLFVPPEEFLGRHVRDVMAGGLADRFERAFADVFESAGPIVVEYRLDMHGSACAYEARLVRAENDTILVIVRDVTEARAAQQALRQSEAALRQSVLENQTLVGRLIAAQEVDRRRIARHLHDNVSQEMAVLNFEVNQLANGHRGDQKAFGRRIRHLSQYVGDIAANLHDLSLRLHPAKLEMLGLVTAVDSICRGISQRHDIVVEFRNSGVPRAIDSNVSMCLYRVVQEALHNIVKHGWTREAFVELTSSTGTIELHVVDQGRGFMPDIRGNSDLGLVSMREWVKLLGGQIAIDSSPGTGVKLAVRIPLQRAVERSAGAAKDAMSCRGGEDQ